MRTTMLIVFNHRHETAVSNVMNYNHRFSPDIFVAAPFARPGCVRYSTGSYMWQGALINYFENHAPTEGHTLVIHDDIAMNPGQRIDDLIGSGDFQATTGLVHLHGEIGFRKVWAQRTLMNWVSSKRHLTGSGVDDVAQVLRTSRLYTENRTQIEMLPRSILTIPKDLSKFSPLFRAWVGQHAPKSLSVALDLPVYIGNADFLLLQNRHGPLIADFLRCTVEAGIFVEVAIPTMLQWLGVPLRFLGDRQILEFGLQTSFSNFASVQDIESYFDVHSDTLSIHPVKFSKFKTKEE